MIYDNVKATGDLMIQVIGPDGKVKETHETKNLVVTIGTNYIASRIVGTARGTMTHMAIGTGNGTPGGAGNLADAKILAAEAARTTLTSQSNADGTNTAVFAATFGANNPNVANTAVVEAGLFNYATPVASPQTGVSPTLAQVMLARTVFPVVNKAAADSITITWTITIGAVVTP